MGAEPHPLVRTNAWLELGAHSTSPVGDLLGAPVTASAVSATTESNGAVCLAANLVDPVRGCEVLACVLASPESTLEIGKQMLGEASDAEAADALAEVVNVVAGVVKAAFVTDGFTFTLGLPGRLSPGEFQDRQGSALASAAVNLSLGEHQFVLSYLVTETAILEMLAEDLREGYVLAQDLRLGGEPLLPSATRLTEGTARQIREACKGMRVKVCAPMRPWPARSANPLTLNPPSP